MQGKETDGAMGGAMEGQEQLLPQLPLPFPEPQQLQTPPEAPADSLEVAL